MTTVRAAVCRAFGAPLEIENVVLRDPRDGEVRVRISACAVCHSDISYADGAWGGELPAVYGHEAAGVVEAVGPGAAKFEPGDRVVVTLIRACGHCEACRTGNPTICFTEPGDPAGPISSDGTPVVRAMNCGAFAEAVVVDQSQIVEIPADMPMDVASLLACGVITGIGAAVNTAAVRPGQSVVVIGAGGVGLNAIQGARIAGASRIVAMDTVPDKLEVAKEFGATDGVSVNSEKPWREVLRITGGGAHACIVTVGAIPAYNLAPRLLRPGGTMVMAGMPHSGDMAEYEPAIVAYTRQGFRGTKMGDVVIQRDIPWMVDLYRQGRLKLDELISGRWTLDRINEAIADTKSGAARRNVILFD